MYSESLGLITEVIVLALATWRIAVAVSSEEGPWGIFYHIRRRLGVIHHSQYVEIEYTDDSGQELSKIFVERDVVDRQPTWVSRGMTCIYCLSWTIGIVLAFLWGLVSGPEWELLIRAPIIGLGASALAIVINKVIR